MTLSIAIAGAGGRMGRALVRAAHEDPRFAVCGGTEHSEGQFLGIDLGALAGIAPLMMNTSETANLAADKAEVWIDFTSPEGSVAALDALVGTPVRAAVIGTTFSAVSITFCLVVISQVKLEHMFVPFYLTVCLAGVVAAIVVPRLPPLSWKKDVYSDGTPLCRKQESVPHQHSVLSYGYERALTKAEGMKLHVELAPTPLQPLLARGQELGERRVVHRHQLEAEQRLHARQHHARFLERVADGLAERLALQLGVRVLQAG